MGHNNNNNNNLASASFDVMSEPLIPTQIVNAVMPSILAISNNVLNASTEATTNEHDNVINRKHVRNNVANSNADFDLSIDDLSDFVDSTEKNDATAQPTLARPDRIEDKATHLTPEEIVYRMSRSPCQKMKS